MKQFALSFVLCAVTVAVGSGLVYFFAVLPARAAAEAPPEPQPPTPGTNVHVEVLAPAPFEDILYLTGQALAWETIDISSEANGRIDTQEIEIGEAVKKGDELFQIDTVAIQADHAHAKASLALAQEELKRAEGLRKSGVAAPQLLDQARTEEQLAQVALRSVQVRLDRSTVRAPIDGVVSVLHKELGEFADFGTALCEIVQTDRLNAAIPVPEREIGRFKEGDQVRIRFDAIPDKAYEGTIFRIQPTADLVTRTYPVEIEIQNPEGEMKPGMTARAEMVRERIEDAITVPLFAIRPMENQYFVMIEQEGVAHMRQIMPGKLNGDRVHVLSGVAAGDRLIVSGHRELREGAAVVVREAGVI
jgi:membrane fusion protein (multidrug efflux system)